MRDQIPPEKDSALELSPGSPGTDPTVRYADGNVDDDSVPQNSDFKGGVRIAPKRLGKYELHGRIGSGGMGVVYKGFDPDLSRMVAIKVLQPHLAQSEVARRRFQREARAAAAISHENVLTIHSVEEQDQVPFLVMEFVSGMSLKEYILRRGSLPSLEIIRLSAQVANGLAAAHGQGVIHRDIKPGNVMLHDGETRVRLMDFGLARVTHDNSDLTSHDQTVGTPAYMSPEQIHGGPIDARSDLYSLGCVIYCMATGQSPFHGGSYAETVHRILDFKPPRLQQISPLIPPVVSDLVDHLLAKRPEDRFQSAEEVSDILTHLVSVLNQTASGELETAIRREPVARPGDGSSAKHVRRKDRNRGSRAVVGAGIALIALVAAALALWWNRGQEKAGPAGGVTISPPATSPPRLASVIVGRGPDATCATLAEAVERIASAGVITIQNGGVYEEAISLSGLDAVTIRGEAGVVLRPAQADAEESSVIAIKDCRDLRIEGLRLESTGKKGRTLSLQGDLSGIAFDDCEFFHVGEASDLSLVNVKALERADQKSVRFHRSRFQRGPGKGYCVSVEARDGTVMAVECEECRFRSKGSLFYLGLGARKATLRRNLFLEGDTGVLLRFRPWKGSEQIDISNNTFLGVRYWLSWMDSTVGPGAASGGMGARLANNLILGGTRTLGPDAQWETMLATWTIQSNYWEQDEGTTSTADRGGRLAMMFPSFDIPNRTDESAGSFLRPADGSLLGSQGAGGDLPTFIGAVEPVEAGSSSPSPPSPPGESSG
ncbi:Serine/threonine-protein kinase PknL [Caulifigura coniformis]|uniref:non-specific serine/threonine protein kinase n=1 Tax=Caulifigura coniformis TaxID=2527983 RepID=A0A517SDR9_9PLAN|nr:serine/threonine-protein kinase [Caulifigura coniformis]QDT54274.1 Serine/threonine-protein kinase PknL [Caulifigura coniformis]